MGWLVHEVPTKPPLAGDTVLCPMRDCGGQLHRDWKERTWTCLLCDTEFVAERRDDGKLVVKPYVYTPDPTDLPRSLKQQDFRGGYHNKATTWPEHWFTRRKRVTAGATLTELPFSAVV